MRYMDFRGCEKIVRINSIDTEYWQEDLRAVLPEKPELILLPKTGTAADVLAADAFMTQMEESLGMEQGSVGLMPLIETALGVENAFAIASAAKRVRALFLGAEDLTADLQCKRTKEGKEIFYARTRLVVAARAAGVDVYDTPFTDVNDDAGIWEDAALAKSLGFTGKASISPRHVEVINQVFSPTAAEIEYAYEVMDAIELAKKQGKGAISLRGKMIDAPIVSRARQTIAMAEALGIRREED
jgi:citrate lyase subunit beta/citryl-CoA lyase